MRQLVVAVGQRCPRRDPSLPRAAAAATVVVHPSHLPKSCRAAPISTRALLRLDTLGINRMNRTGLVIAFAVAAAVGLIFGIRPDLDLKLAALFFDPERGGFWRAYDPTYLRARDVAVWLTTLVA